MSQSQSQVVLRQTLAPDDETWEFTYPLTAFTTRRNQTQAKKRGKMVSLSSNGMILRMEQFPANRILNADDTDKFVLLSIDRSFRFYGHSNSQLRGRSCFLREANSDKELDDRIYVMGDFGRIMNVAKRAKRIGLLFSSAEVDFTLDPALVADIPDITAGDENFSDGCGLMSKRLAMQVAKAKKIIFRGQRYTPTVFQIRYLGYKGVLMLHPELDNSTTNRHLAEFRKSMKKFSTTLDHSFSVVGYSKPYTFGRLNNDIIVLLSSLGVTPAALLAKQQEYFNWISGAAKDVVKAVDFLSSLGAYPTAEKVLLEGLESESVQREIRRLQNAEVASFKAEVAGGGGDKDKFKSRMIIHKSRRLYGVCDPFQVLKEGQVHIRITASRKGATTPIHGDVIIVRNPCLHPGDILKLRAVDHPQLSHLTDCLVFASVARPGHKAAPSMSSGGDLDGDEFFSYDYPGNKEFNKKDITRMIWQLTSLHTPQPFINYSVGVAKVSALHAKWSQSSPLGALCVECQELNALHSQSVDGANIRIPDRLKTPPEPPEGTKYILDQLKEAADEFATSFTQSASRRAEVSKLDSQEDAEELMAQLLRSKQNSVSEFELFNLAYRLSQKYMVDIKPYLSQLDFSALTTTEKKVISTTLSLSGVDYPEIWNSLLRSDILTPRDLYQRNLAQPFAIHRLYSSRVSGGATFFEYLKMATRDYSRKLLIIQTDKRFSVGIFMRGEIPWDEDPAVKDPTKDRDIKTSNKDGDAMEVVVCSFMPESGSTIATLRPCPEGYRLHCSDNRFQLYDRHIGNTFVYVNRPPAEHSADVATSIALQKISRTVQTQLGRVNKAPALTIELHVVSNRDRVAHQLFDLWFDHVPTEETIRRFQRTPAPYRFNDLKDVDWNSVAEDMQEIINLKGIFFRNIPNLKLSSIRLKHNEDSMAEELSRRMMPEIEKAMSIAIHQQPFPRAFAVHWIEQYPPLTFTLLKAYPPDESLRLQADLEPFAHLIIRNIIRELSLQHYIELLMLTAMSVRAKTLVQEVLLVLNDSRLEHCEESPVNAYGHKHALGVAFDRAEEAADECPCNEDGRPRKKMRVPPSHAKLTFGPKYSENGEVIANIRIDARNSIRLHSHVRLQAASKAENRWIEAPIMDGVVVQAEKGQLKINLFHPAPPEMEAMDWNMYDAGSTVTATSNAMMDAIQRLLNDGEDACAFHGLITGADDSMTYDESEFGTFIPGPDAGLNESQVRAVESWRKPLSLIWGPPGKTTVIVQVLFDIIRKHENVPKILMTASTHNAVDNVLERFIAINDQEKLLTEEQILRVATDQSKVNPSLQHYTINARVGGDMNENNRLFKQAQERLGKATIVFTTCAGAGLGILRKPDFDIALIDEASQITEPCALIPLVKGIKRAVIVGDHVQLRPTVRNMAKALEYDMSLLERLYTRSQMIKGLAKTMLDVQYRSPRILNVFPSNEFYEGQLKTSEKNAEVSDFLSLSQFPWPTENGSLIPTVFIQCDEEEDMGTGQKAIKDKLILYIKLFLYWCHRRLTRNQTKDW
ncbi:RNA dependent RNA polymerase-domain-containing protein [Gymnopilus junonius]|uniref:RNA dependent RNA polymerase-domain-containing protein n=1 Tax=Gymnopilus junonius TaxID=109634 RepID=A0A9P5NDY7_GYMJU|nr:RNA dependent RNA polymerase-domain-containing protein [Gymnopilus junonius]